MKRNTRILLISVVLVILGLFFVLEKDDGSFKSSHDISGDNSKETVEVMDEDMEEYEEVQIDRSAPDFTLPNLKGEQISLSDYRGDIVFLNFWATWCGYCDEEMPYFQHMIDKNDDLTVLAVNVQEPEAKVRNYIEKGGYSFPVLLDMEGEIGGDYLVGGLPTTYLIDKEGNLLSQIPGMMTQDQMEEILIAIRELD